MCVCISQTCLTLNNRFQTEMVVGVRAATWRFAQFVAAYGDTWYARFRAPQAVPSCVDFGRGDRHRRRSEDKGRERAPRPRSPSCAPVSCSPPAWCSVPVGAMPRGRRCGCWRKVAAEREGLASWPSAVPAWQRPQNLRILLAIVFRCAISAIGVKCSAPAVEFVERDAGAKTSVLVFALTVDRLECLLAD
jgi:hypothetical protein